MYTLDIISTNYGDNPSTYLLLLRFATHAPLDRLQCSNESLEVILPRSDLQLVLDGVHCSAISAISATSAIRALGKLVRPGLAWVLFYGTKLAKTQRLCL